MRSFRVYNRVRKVGVTWRVAGVEFGIPSMTALFLILASVVTLSALAAFFGGGAAAALIGVSGVVIFLGAFVMISRLVGMGRLAEGTQFRLLVDSMRRRRYKNFSTPDVPGDVNDDQELFTESTSVYRNF